MIAFLEARRAGLFGRGQILPNLVAGVTVGIVHSLFLILVIVLLAPWASGIPLAALAAILFFVAWNMSDATYFLRPLRQGPRADIFLLLTTFCLTVFVDLVVAVNVGVICAALLFMRRMAAAVTIEEQDIGAASDATGLREELSEQSALPRGVLADLHSAGVLRRLAPQDICANLGEVAARVRAVAQAHATHS